jgi:alkylhydroperoxidase family enzyme
MPYISMIDYESASPEVQKAYEDHEKVGAVTNMKKTLLHSVPAFKVMMEWYNLRDEAAKFLSALEISFFCYAISSQNDCLICSTFFRKILKDDNIKFENFEFTARQQILVDFGRALVANAHEVGDEIFDRLKKVFTEEQIVLLTTFGAIMIATNLINTSLKVELDGYLMGY